LLAGSTFGESVGDDMVSHGYIEQRQEQDSDARAGTLHLVVMEDNGQARGDDDDDA
jgi:hypothetical protein